MGGYDFRVRPVEVPDVADYQARSDAAKARKIELQQRQMQLDEAKRQQSLEANQRAAAGAAYQPQSYTPPQSSVNVGGANLGYQPAAVQGPAQFNRGSYITALQKTNPLEAQQAQQQFASSDADQQEKQIKVQQQLAQLHSTELENHTKQLTQSIQLAAPLFQAEASGAPPEQLEGMYQRQLMVGHQMGIDVSQLPPHYVPGLAHQYMSQLVPAKDLFDQENERRKADNMARDKTTQTAAGVLQFNPDTGKYDQNIGKLPKTVAPGVNVTVAGGAAGDFSDAALDQAAELYATSGQMPSLGMGKASSALRVKIANRAAELHPLNNLAENKAGFGADQASLKVVQKSLDSVTAFENTASKNLDQFLTTAAKVPDTGVPWLNQPIRSVNASGLGSADQAAFNAARQVALTEISKVVNNPNLTGTLSDSARKEVMELNPESATFAQIKKVAQVLKTDMANRRTSLTSQRDEIKGRISKSGPTLTNQNPGTGQGDPFSQFGGTAHQ